MSGNTLLTLRVDITGTSQATLWSLMVQWLILLLPSLLQDNCFLSTLSRGPLLREMDTLTVLDLSENAVGDAGAATLAAVLRAAGQDAVGLRPHLHHPVVLPKTHCKTPQPQHAPVCFCSTSVFSPFCMPRAVALQYIKLCCCKCSFSGRTLLISTCLLTGR